MWTDFNISFTFGFVDKLRNTVNKIFHHTWILLPHYLVKFKCSTWLSLCNIIQSPCSQASVLSLLNYGKQQSIWLTGQIVDAKLTRNPHWPKSSGSICLNGDVGRGPVGPYWLPELQANKPFNVVSKTFSLVAECWSPLGAYLAASHYRPLVRKTRRHWRALKETGGL